MGAFIAIWIYTLAAFGFVYILGHARITLGVREWMATWGRREIWMCDEKGCEWRRARFPTPLDHFQCPHHGSVRKVEEFSLVYYPAKWVLSFIECPACLGTWVGFGFGWWQPEFVVGFAPGMTAAVALALYTCAVGFLLGRATGLIPRE